jgi:uncharacterized membrane protein
MKPAARNALSMQKREQIRDVLEKARQRINSLKARSQLLERVNRVGSLEREICREAMEDACQLANLATFSAKLISEQLDELEKEALS